MKAAFLIAAHDQPAHLARLVESLRCDWARIFIHVDRKASVLEYRSRLPRSGDVVVLDDENRVRVTWGGFSLVRAMLNLLDASLGSGEHFDRFCFLSGSDFPIKPLHEIRTRFESDWEFLRVDQRVDAQDSNAHREKVRV